MSALMNLSFMLVISRTHTWYDINDIKAFTINDIHILSGYVNIANILRKLLFLIKTNILVNNGKGDIG